MQNLQNELKDILNHEDSLVIDGQLNKNLIVERALQVDTKLIKLLLKHDTIKRHFFTDVEGVMVFDKIKFQRFVNNKSFLPNSYTAFKNKIGLAINDGTTDNYLISKNDVVLAWPHKDCVLEGGQTKEEQKRNEIFWNETLAPDEIDRLLDPKVLTNWKKYDQQGEQEVTEITDNDNLIIKGNNLLALASLKKRYAGKVKLIYIDPPYNTGNDSFLYNDTFNHSTWLSFMKTRLKLAKELLSEQGTIVISIDNNELSYLQILMDEVFGVINRKNIITVKRGSVTGAKVINPGLVNISEFILVYSKNSNYWKPNRLFKKKDWDTRYNGFILNYSEGIENWKFTTVLKAFADSYQLPKNKLRKVLGDKYESELEKFVYSNSDKVMQPATLDENSVSQSAVELKRESEGNKEKVFVLERENNRPYYIFNGKLILFMKDRLNTIDGEETFSEPMTDIWDDVLPNDLHNEGGIKLRKGKKPEKLIQRIVELCTKSNDLVLDFFIGSGTTASVCNKLDRRFIGIEQLDYIEELPVQRLINTINGEQSGISKSVNWQGGGSFIYCELSKYNQKYADLILESGSKEKLLSIWSEMKEKAFLSYQFDKQTFDERIEAFKTLSFDDQKKFLLEILDKNQLYANYSEIEDVTFNISKDDKKLNKIFYLIK